MIHINRNRQSLGQFTEQEVAEGLQSGRFLADDLAWRQGMDSWQPLSTFADLASVPDQAVVPAPPAEEQAILPTWEKPEPPGFFSSTVESVKEILGTPSETFQAMPVTGGFGRPLRFYLLVSWLTSTVAILVQLAAALVNPAMFVQEGGPAIPEKLLPWIFLSAIVLMPLILLVGIFVSSGLLHGALTLVGGAKKPFEATLRALCYAGGATSVIQMIPLCGGWISTIAWIFYAAIALKVTHRTDLWRPIAAIGLVFVLFCGVIFGTAFLVVALAGAVAGVAPK